jgi:hypothetical protein
MHYHDFHPYGCLGDHVFFTAKMNRVGIKTLLILLLFGKKEKRKKKILI